MAGEGRQGSPPFTHRRAHTQWSWGSRVTHTPQSLFQMAEIHEGSAIRDLKTVTSPPWISMS